MCIFRQLKSNRKKRIFGPRPSRPWIQRYIDWKYELKHLPIINHQRKFIHSNLTILWYTYEYN